MTRLTHEIGESANWRELVKRSNELMADGKPVRYAFKQWFTAFAWPGGYTIIFVNDSNDTLCANCALQDFIEGKDITAGTYDEGPMVYCDECAKEMESSYGNLDEQE